MGVMVDAKFSGSFMWPSDSLFSMDSLRNCFTSGLDISVRLGVWKPAVG